MQTLQIGRINLPKLHTPNLQSSKRSFLQSGYRVPQESRRLSIKTHQDGANSIEQYHNMFNRRHPQLKRAAEQSLQRKKRIAQPKSRSQTKWQQDQREQLGRLDIFRGITREINQIKKQLSQQKEFRINSLQRNISRIAAMRRQEGNFTPQYNHMPMIIPVYLPLPFAGQTEPLKYHVQRPRETRVFDSYKTKSRITTQSKLRKPKTSKKWKKHVYCVLFVIRLRRFCRLVRLKRKNQFGRLWTGLAKKIGKIQSEFVLIIKQQESGIFGKKDALHITRDQTDPQINNKVTLLREVVNQILSKIKLFLQRNSSNRGLSQSLYHLCNHGNYSCSQPVLTKEQLQMTCISPQLGCVSADHNLQSIALLNLLIIKLLLFNTLLAKNRYQLEQNQYQITKNTMAVSSAVYELAMDIENEYLLKAPSSYEIGNYEQHPNIRGLESMCINNVKNRGELISGLRQNKVLMGCLEVAGWTKQKKLVVKIVELGRGIMKRYHSQFVKQFL